MVGTLPSIVRLKLEQTLAQWRHWQPKPSKQPVAVERLDRGISNFSVKVAAGDGQWVVRIDRVAPERLGLSRNAEWRAMQLAAAEGLCPHPVYHNPQIGCLVTPFQRGDNAPSTDDMNALATLLRGIHALPKIKFRLNPLHRALRYLAVVGERVGGEQMIDERVSGEQIAPQILTDVCESLSLDANAPEPVLCHNDLLRDNRLASGGRLLALDWEYAAVGDPFFDLAVIVEGDCLDDEQANNLLEHWLDAPASPEQQHRLHLQRQVYRELTRLWGLAFERLQG